jgi:hypothetical protein
MGTKIATFRMNPEEGSVERILYCNRYYVVQWRW